MNYVQMALSEAKRLQHSKEVGHRSYLMKRAERCFRRLKTELEAFDGMSLLSGNSLVTEPRSAFLSPAIRLLEQCSELGDQQSLVYVFVEVLDGNIVCRAECLWDGTCLTSDCPEGLMQVLAISLGSVLTPQ